MKKKSRKSKAAPIMRKAKVHINEDLKVYNRKKNKKKPERDGGN